MKTIRTVLIGTALVAAQTALAGDLDGTWLIDIESASGKSSSVLTLVQKQNVISGTYNGRFGEAPLTGTANGAEFEISVQTEVQSVPIDVKYVGTVHGDAMNGTITVVGFGEGAFKGARKR